MVSRSLRAVRRNLVAWLALFVAMGGTSLAATHYVITSSKQIKPSVLRQLRGAHGRTGGRGPTGASGQAGVAGAKGQTGAAGAIGSTGAAGAEGATGEEGTPGEPGDDGTTVVARVRSVAPAVTATTTPESNPTFTPYALSGGEWTQEPDENEQRLSSVEVTTPNETACSNGELSSGRAQAIVYILVNGVIGGEVELPAEGNSHTVSQPIAWRTGALSASHGPFFGVPQIAEEATLWEPGATMTRTLTAEIADSCGVNGGATGGHFTIDSLKMDVLGAS